MFNFKHVLKYFPDSAPLSCSCRNCAYPLWRKDQFHRSSFLPEEKLCPMNLFSSSALFSWVISPSYLLSSMPVPLHCHFHSATNKAQCYCLCLFPKWLSIVTCYVSQESARCIIVDNFACIFTVIKLLVLSSSEKLCNIFQFNDVTHYSR